MTENNTAIVLAAGQGKRMKSNVQKQFLQLGEYPVLYYSLKAFQDSPEITDIVLVCGKTEINYCKDAFVQKYHIDKVSEVVAGGKERYESVYQGLCACHKTDYVLIHDGARPMVSEDILERCFQDAQKYNACVAAVPVKDTIKIADENGFAETTPRRDRVWQVQTPQTFSFGLIYDAYARLAEQKDTLAGKGIKITDDAMVVETFTDHQVKLTEGSYRNLKVTTPEDLPLAEKYLHS